MSAVVEGEGRCSKPTVEVGVAHVGCAEDAAAFVALAAAVDLSMDACRLFSHKLRKELSHLRSDVLRRPPAAGKHLIPTSKLYKVEPII